MATHRAVAYLGTRKLGLQNLDFLKLILGPNGSVCS